MLKNNNTINWAIRVLISFLFLLSAVAKMFPLWAFEKQLVDLGITTWCQSHYVARLLLGVELAIGLAILLPHYLKKIIIPSTILLLVMFCIHLTIEMVKHGAMNGNCGCFGQLIPMTPLEAFLKNVVTIGLLVFLWFRVSDKEKGQNRIIYPVASFLGASLLVFMLFPFTPCSKESPKLTSSSATSISANTAYSEMVDSISSKTSLAIDSSAKKDSVMGDKKTIALKDTSLKTLKQATTKTVQNAAAPVAKMATASTGSRFGAFTNFGGKAVNLEQGNKIVCMFAAGCDHCQATAKELAIMAKQPGFPEIYILFMDEETEKIPEFFKIAEATIPYIVLDIPRFWDVIGTGSTPGVFYLQNGKIIKSYQGIDKEKFNGPELKTIIGK